jgi:hypothetical protein
MERSNLARIVLISRIASGNNAAKDRGTSRVMDDNELTRVFECVLRGEVVEGWTCHRYRTFDILTCCAPHRLFARKCEGCWVELPEPQ